MDITYQNQFQNDPLDQVPDIHMEYYLDRYHTSNGFTYLFKLLYLHQNCYGLIDKIPEYAPQVNILVGGVSPLHFVCNNYKSDKLLEVMELLIKMGADVNAKDGNNNNILHRISRDHMSNDFIKMLNLLIRGGVDVNAKNISNLTALHLVSTNCGSDELLEIVKILIKEGIDVNVKDCHGRTCMHNLCNCYKSDTLPKVMRLLIGVGININYVDIYGFTILHYACVNRGSYKLPEIIQLLIDARVDINAKPYGSSRNALYYICGYSRQYNCLKAIKLLIQSGIELDVSAITYDDNPEIYEEVMTYHKHNAKTMKTFMKYFGEEQIKLLDYFTQFKISLEPIPILYNQFYYRPHNIGSLICESNFSTGPDKYRLPYKTLFLFR